MFNFKKGKIIQSEPEKPNGFWNEITFWGNVEKFINTDRYSPMSTELQTALHTMTASMEAPRSGQAGF
jgi:hypothetical protein